MEKIDKVFLWRIHYSKKYINTMEDVYHIIFELVSMTGKRAFACVSNVTYTLFKDKLSIAELEFQKMINRTNFVTNLYYSGFYDTMHKRTIELVYDNCTHLIPDSYIVLENEILDKHKIHERLGKNGDLKMIVRLSKLRFTSTFAEYVMRGAAKAGNIDILEKMNIDKSVSSDLIIYAVNGNQIKTLKWLLEKFPHSISLSAVRYAVKKNNVEMMEFLVLEKNCNPTYAGYHAAYNGRRDIVKFMFDYVPDGYKMRFLGDVRSGGISGGHLDVVEFVFDHGYSHPFNHVPCTDINVLRWLVSKKYVICNQKVLESVTSYGNLECFEYVLNLSGLVLDDVFQQILKIAVRGCCKNIVKFLLDRECLYDKDIILGAVDSYNQLRPDGNAFSMLKLFKVTEWPKRVFQDAARSGNLNVLQYGYDNNCINDQEIKRGIMNVSVAGGHLHVIIWARSCGYEWDSTTIVNAADVNIIKWLRNIDNYRAKCRLVSSETKICPWDERVCLNAIRYGKLPFLKLAVENGCEYGDATLEAVRVCKYNSIKEYMATKISR